MNTTTQNSICSHIDISKHIIDEVCVDLRPDMYGLAISQTHMSRPCKLITN